jgi:hypothetical protein
MYEYFIVSRKGAKERKGRKGISHATTQRRNEFRIVKKFNLIVAPLRRGVSYLFVSVREIFSLRPLRPLAS